MATIMVKTINMANVAEYTEKISLGSCAKKQNRYGSMAKENGILNEKYVKHIVQTGDTLQGLSLRYGVTMEQIKRANKMWTTDSLFLRSSLNIPVDREALTISSISSPPQTPVKNGVIANCDTDIDLSNHLNSTVYVNGVEIEKEESAADFLIRIDSHIAQTKDKVVRLQNKIVYSEDDLNNSRCGYQFPESRLQGSSSLSNLSADPSVLPTVVMTKGRKVKSSLRKLERQQDEIFEL